MIEFIPIFFFSFVAILSLILLFMLIKGFIEIFEINFFTYKKKVFYTVVLILSIGIFFLRPVFFNYSDTTQNNYIEVTNVLVVSKRQCYVDTWRGCTVVSKQEQQKEFTLHSDELYNSLTIGSKIDMIYNPKTNTIMEITAYKNDAFKPNY